MTYDYVIPALETSYDISCVWIIARFVVCLACLMQVYMLGRFLLGVFWVSMILQWRHNPPWYWILSFFFISKLCGWICFCVRTCFLVTPIVLGHHPWFHHNRLNFTQFGFVSGNYFDHILVLTYSFFCLCTSTWLHMLVSRHATCVVHATLIGGSF